jgi:hypothetical protein
MSGRCSTHTNRQFGHNKARMNGFLKAWIGRKRRQPEWKTQRRYRPRILLLLSVTQPGQNVIDPCGFAALVRTRCAFIVSGAASNSCRPGGKRAFGKANSTNKSLSTTLSQPRRLPGPKLRHLRQIDEKLPRNASAEPPPSTLKFLLTSFSECNIVRQFSTSAPDLALRGVLLSEEPKWLPEQRPKN